MTTNQIAFAVPGKISKLTGGTLYDRRVIEALPGHGIDVLHVELPDNFPLPTPHDIDETFDRLATVPRDVPLVIDGLAFGALSPERLAQVQAPLVPLVHHPLAEESGLSDDIRAHLYSTELANLAHARHVLVPSPHTAAILSEKYNVPADRITIARPGTDQPTRVATPTKPPLILSVGIQVPRKGHDILLEALSEIKDLEWRAIIAGAPLDAAFAQTLRTFAAQSGLDGRVAIPGQIERAELQSLYAEATVFALATRYEGYGIVFDEALTHGLPIVSCTTGAVPDTVPDGAGLLVPVDTPGAFADALRQLLTDHPKRKSCAAAAKAAGRNLPSWSDTAGIIAQALDRLFAQPLKGTDA